MSPGLDPPETTPTSTVLTVTPASPLTYSAGAAIAFVATVLANDVTATAATGTVTFKRGTTTLGTAALTRGVATYSISGLASGNYQFTAEYGGNTRYDSSGSESYPFSVVAQSLRVRIMNAVLAALNGSSKPTGLPDTVLERTVEITPDGCPAMTLYAGHWQHRYPTETVDPVDEPETSAVKRHFHFRVECRAIGSSTQSPSEAADAMAAWAVAGLSNSSLGGLVHKVVEASTWQLVEGSGHPDALVIVEFDAEYWTLVADATSKLGG